MQTFKQYITEVFDNPFEWKWARKSEGMYEAFFNSEENEFRVQITNVEDGGQIAWNIGYEAKDEKGRWSPFVELKEYSASKVLATLNQIIKKFVEEMSPPRVIFTGDKNEIGRAGVYSKLLQRELPNEYEVEQKENNDNVKFIITKREE